MARLTAFISGAKESLDFAVYDMRFCDSLKGAISAALRERAGAGVKIRFCFHGNKPFQPNMAAGQDPAPPGTSAFVQSLGYPWRQIAGMKLMHNKFIVRDGQSIWTGSTNMTDDAFTLMENNIVEIESASLATNYAEEFEELWEKKISITPANFTPWRRRSLLEVKPATRASCFLRGVDWKSIPKLRGAFARRSAVFGSAAC